MIADLQTACPARTAAVQDQFGRTIDYLRISLTDMCNLRCRYCMPEDMCFRPTHHLLRDDELLRLAALFARLGVRKIRLTGGEPTLRQDLPRLVREMVSLDGVRTVALTTNGILLDQLARPLAQAGLQRVNISLDTLDSTKYREVTRWGNLRDVWKGIHAAEEAGLEVKINAVVVRGFNDHQDLVELARLTYAHPWQIRFIELMPFGGPARFQRNHIVPESELLRTLSESLAEPELLNQGRLDGEARMFRLPGAKGTLGFISSVTHPFCAGCRRIRLTADGMLRLCLLRSREVDLKEHLRSGADDRQLMARIRRAIWDKPWGHALKQQAFATNRTMSEIGG